jgi:branched-chain amino acid transport system substrate-binding protein
MRRLRPSVGVTAVALVAAALAAGCGSSDDSSNNSASAAKPPAQSKLSEPIVIGGAIAETGGMSIFDVPAWSTFKMAIEEINAKGGVLGQKVKLITANTASTLDGAKAGAQSVIDRGATVVMVTCNFDMSAPAANLAQQKGKIAFTLCAASPKFGAQGIGPLAFSAQNATHVEGAIEAQFAIDKGWKKSFLLEDNTIDYGQEIATGFREAYTKLGGTIAGHDTFKNDDASIAAQITKIRGSGAEVIELASYNPGGASAVRQIRAAGIDLPIVSTIGLDGTYWIKAVPKLSNFYSTGTVPLSGDDPNAKVNEVLKQYEEQTGAPLASSLGITGYIDAQLITDAIKEAGSVDPEKIAKTLEAFKDHPTLVGKVTYTPETHIVTNRPMAVSKYTNGKPKLEAYVTPPSDVDLHLGG